MPKTVIPVLVLGIAAAAAGYALADDKPGPDWMPPDQVVQRLTAAGYSAITGLEADDGVWEGKAVHNGKIIEFHVDPKTGAILSEKPDED